MTHPVTKKAENSWDEPMLCLHITVLIWVFRHFSLVKSAKNPKMSVMGKMVFMHKQRFPKCSLLKMWYITAWRSYKTHRILDRWKMALQFDSSVYWSLTRHVCAKGVCQEVIKGDGEKSQELDCNRSHGECKCETFGLNGQYIRRSERYDSYYSPL